MVKCNGSSLVWETLPSYSTLDQSSWIQICYSFLCDNRSFAGDSSLSKPHQEKYLNKIWDFLILRFSFWMLLMQIEFHAFPSVLSWFHGASFKPTFAAIEEAFPSHFFRFFHHLTASSPQAWQFSPSWLRFVVFVFLFLNSLQYWSAQWFCDL